MSYANKCYYWNYNFNKSLIWILLYIFNRVFSPHWILKTFKQITIISFQMDETVNHKNLQSDVIRMNASSQRTNKKEIEYLKALSDGPLIVGGGSLLANWIRILNISHWWDNNLDIVHLFNSYVQIRLHYILISTKLDTRISAEEEKDTIGRSNS